MTLECRFHRRYPVAVAGLAGTLDKWTAVDAVIALQECLADEQPVVLVLDLAELRVRDPAAPRSLAQLARRIHRWPGTQLVLSGADPQLATVLTQAAPAGTVDTFGGTDEAVAAAEQRPVPPRERADLPPTTQAPVQCREIIARACRSWRLAGLQPLAQLLASELVTNAVVHAGTVLSFTVCRGDTAVQVAVRDRDPRLVDPPPTPAHGTALADLSRGLLLLETLADDWGCLATGDGKAVWASMTRAEATA